MKNIYILHGWSYDVSKWSKLIDLFKVQGLNVIVLKIPGLTGKINSPWTLDDYIDWLTERLKSKKDVILLGHSNGGRIALAYCLKNGDKVSKLILIDSAGIYHNELPIRIKRYVFGSLAKIGKKFTNSNIIRKMFYKIVGESDYNKASEVMKITMNNLINTNLLPRLREIKNKTLIIWGLNDGVTPVSDGRLMADNIPHSKLVIIDDARHSPQFTHSEKVSEEILKFLK